MPATASVRDTRRDDEVMAVVVITGCSSGIGLAAAVAFARRGDTVHATMRDPDGDRDLIRAAGDAAERITVTRLDVTDAAMVGEVIGSIEAAEGAIDVLVNNAGVSIFEPIEYSTDEHWRLAVDTNLLGPVWTSRAVIPAMRRRGSGVIVNVSSIAGRLAAIPTQAAYAVTKHGLCAFSDALALELGEFGIRTYCIEPGFIATPIKDKGVELAVADDDPYAEIVRSIDEFFVEGLAEAPAPDGVAQLILEAADQRLGNMIHHPIAQPGALPTATSAREP